MELKKAKRLAEELMALHNCDYAFKFDGATLRCGLCNHETKTISLSRSYCKLNGEDSVRDTILHEIAHTKSVGDGHGARWRREAKAIGCTARVYAPLDTITAPRKWKATCTTCGRYSFRYRKGAKLACRKCCTKFNNGEYSEKYLLEWTRI